MLSVLRTQLQSEKCLLRRRKAVSSKQGPPMVSQQLFNAGLPLLETPAVGTRSRRIMMQERQTALIIFGNGKNTKEERFRCSVSTSKAYQKMSESSFRGRSQVWGRYV